MFSDLRKVFRILGSFQSVWKFLWPETWHLRHRLHFWQLRTTIWTITLWPLNREWWWQPSQFLRCFVLITFRGGTSEKITLYHKDIPKTSKDIIGGWVVPFWKRLLTCCWEAEQEVIWSFCKYNQPPFLPSIKVWAVVPQCTALLQSSGGSVEQLLMHCCRNYNCESCGF